MPNFQETQWLAFCLETVHQYQWAFHKSELEFDIARLGFTRALGTAADQAAADAFFAELAASRLFIAYNGLEAHDDDLLTGAPNPAWQAPGFKPLADAIDADLRYLLGYRRSSGRIGLESARPLQDPRIGTADLQNVAKIQHVVSIFQPARLVFFDDLALGIVSPDTSPFHAARIGARPRNPTIPLTRREPPPTSIGTSSGCSDADWLSSRRHSKRRGPATRRRRNSAT